MKCSSASLRSFKRITFEPMVGTEQQQQKHQNAENHHNFRQFFVRPLLLSLGGSLSEVFYGLSRIRSKSSTLTRRDKWLAFLLVVVLPYVKAKFEALLAKWDSDCDNLNVDSKTALRRQHIQRSYRAIKGVHDLLQVIQYVGYLSDRFDTHSILSRVIGQHLIYSPMETSFEWSWSDLFAANFKRSTILSGMLFRGLELSAFFLQFIQWWQNETSNGSLTKLPNAEPPSRPTDTRYDDICPICLQKWAIPTVNRVSGYASWNCSLFRLSILVVLGICPRIVKKIR